MADSKTTEVSHGDPSEDLPVINAPFQFWRGLPGDVKEVISQRQLLRSLIARELRQRYKGSFLGWGWALIRPLVMLAIYGLAVGVFLGAGASIPEFGIYLYVGLIAWALFAAIVSGSINSLPSNTALISKAPFRRELLIVAVVAVAIVDFLLQAIVLTVGYLFYGAWPNLQSMWWFLAGFTALTVLATGLGLLLSALNVRFRDVGYFVDVALQVGFFLVPILYSYSMVQTALSSQPAVLGFYTANPTLAPITALRYALWPSSASETGASQLLGMQSTLVFLAMSFVLGITLVWLGQRIFSRMSSSIAQEL